MKIKTTLLFSSFVYIIFLSGCASTPQTGCSPKDAWYKPGISAEEQGRDLAECQYAALVNGRSYSPIPTQNAGAAIALGMLASSAENSRQNQIVQTCMISKGYSLVKTNSPLLKDSQPPTQTPQQNEANKKAFEEIKDKAESGDAEAQNQLGVCYHNGTGVVKDYAKAMKWVRKAAEQNNAWAQFNVGYFYACGKGVAKDTVEAVKWYHKSAEQGNDEAQRYLGSCYGNGEGVLKDYVESYKWILLAAANGSTNVSSDMSYLENRMTREQTAEGQKLAREFVPQKGYTLFANMTAEQLKKVTEKNKAKAESGDAEAQYQLGTFYLTGDLGVTIDLTEAIKWYQKAADQNYPNMQLPLASAFVQRGILEQSKGNADEALADFNKAIKIKPDFTEVYWARGCVKQSKEDFDGALTDYNRVIEMNPKFALAYFMRGLLNYNLHKFTDALADFYKSRELNLDAEYTDYSHIYVWLIRARLGEQDAATKGLQTYLNDRKTGTTTGHTLNAARFLAGQLTELNFFKAVENANQQIDKEQHCEAYFYAGSKRLIEGDKTTAADYFEKCLATDVKKFTEYRSAAIELKFLETSR